MKILNSIRKKWLQYRVYKYLLKSQDALSKSKVFHQKSLQYKNLVSFEYNSPLPWIANILDFNEKASKYSLKSEHYENLADIYSRKRVDLETQLCNLSYRKV